MAVFRNILHRLFYLPGRMLDAFAASVDEEINPKTDFVGMCRCGEPLRTKAEQELGECADHASRWW